MKDDFALSAPVSLPSFDLDALSITILFNWTNTIANKACLDGA